MYLCFIAADTLLQARDFFHQNRFLIGKATSARRQFGLLRLNDGALLGILCYFVGQRRGQLYLLRGIDLGVKSRRGCQKPRLPCHETTKLGLRSRIVQSYHRLVGFDDISFLDQKFSNDSPFQVLHLLILSGGNERAGRNDSAGQWSRCSPRTKSNSPNQQYQRADHDWAARIMLHVAMPSMNSGTVLYHCAASLL